MFPFAAPESVLSNFETSHLSKGESSMSLETWFAESETEKKKNGPKVGRVTSYLVTHTSYPMIDMFIYLHIEVGL